MTTDQTRWFRQCCNWVTYQLNHIFSLRPWLIGIAFLIFAVVIGTVAAWLEARAEWLFGSQAGDPPEDTWRLLKAIFTINSDSDVDKSPWWHKGFFLFVTLGGVIVAGAVAGSGTEVIGRWMRRLQRGRSQVMEHGHTVVIGWTTNTALVLEQLIEANRSIGGRAIVVLAEVDKVTMDQELRERIPRSRRFGSKVITRTGTAARHSDLHMVAADRARSIILIPPDDDGLNRAVTCLAAMSTYAPVAKRMSQTYRNNSPKLTIVAPVGDESGCTTLREIDANRGIWVPHCKVTAQLMAHAIRQSGLGKVYEDLLTFSGSELYLWPTIDRRTPQHWLSEARTLFHPNNWHRAEHDGYSRHQSLRGLLGRRPSVSNVVGLTFRQVQHGFIEGCAVGIRSGTGETYLNPPGARRLEADDELIVLATDNSHQHIKFDHSAVPPLAAESTNDNGDPVSAARLNVLMLGFGKISAATIQELDGHAGAGSQVNILSQFAEAEEEILQSLQGLTHIKIKFECIKKIQMSDIESAMTSDLDSIMVVPDGTYVSPHTADMGTVHRLLQVRAVIKRRELKCRLVTEILDDRNVDLCDGASPDDAIVSDRFISLYCLQIAQEPKLENIYRELLDSSGCEVSMHAVQRYLPMGTKSNWHTAIDAASRSGATAIGYRFACDAKSREQRFGITLNPPKNQQFAPADGDSLIVIAER